MEIREKTIKLNIGNVTLGGSNNILIQSMCNIKTSKVDQVVEQINDCEKLGADLMRVSILDIDDAKAIKEIKKHINIPLVADIHFDYKLAIEAILNGVDKIRINPGNIGGTDKLDEIISLAKTHNVSIRIGVNSGSMDQSIYNYNDELTAEKMIESLDKYVKYFENKQFYNLVLSLKSSDVKTTIKAYKLAAEMFNYPLHIGLTEAGLGESAVTKSVAALAPLLLKGIGNTIRISMTGDPQQEIIVAKELLGTLKLRDNVPNIISCPTCGRTMVNTFDIVKQLKNYLKYTKKQLTIAVMGCVVNGPGEAKHADIGIAGGNGYFVLFRKGVVVKKIDEKNAINELIAEINKIN